MVVLISFVSGFFVNDLGGDILTILQYGWGDSDHYCYALAFVGGIWFFMKWAHIKNSKPPDIIQIDTTKELCCVYGRKKRNNLTG